MNVYFTLAQVYLAKENYIAAVDILKKASFTPEIAHTLATTYMAMGKYDETLEITNKLIHSGVPLSCLGPASALSPYSDHQIIAD